MKNCKVIMLLVVALFMTMPIFAQKSTKKVAKETAEAVSQLDENQQKMILNFTRNLQEPDVKKEMSKAMKKMSVEDQQKVLDFVAKVNNMGKPVVVDPELAQKATVKKPTIAKANKIEAISPESTTLTEIEILDKTFDFGTIPQGEKAAYTYKVKNIGDHPLIISKAKGSCGCTVPSWPKEPIAVGEIAEIKVVFNSRGKKGKQNKRITLTTNTDPAQNYMTITGLVEVPPAKTEK